VPASNYAPDRKGLAKFLRSKGLARAIHRQAEVAARIAAARMPRETGELASSVHVEDTEITSGGSTRVASIVVADAPYAQAIEFGARDGDRRGRVRGRHVMGAVAEAMSPRKRRI
jgi:hypothetical protein